VKAAGRVSIPRFLLGGLQSCRNGQVWRRILWYNGYMKVFVGFESNVFQCHSSYDLLKSPTSVEMACGVVGLLDTVEVSRNQDVSICVL
jgi:hypothetical protein